MTDEPGQGHAPEPANRRIVIRGVSSTPSEAGKAPASDPDPDPGARSASESTQARTSGGLRSAELKLALAIAGVGGALLALAPLLPWWHVDVASKGQALPQDVATFASIRGVQQWPGLLCVILGAVILVSVVVASKPDTDAVLRATLGRVVLGAGVGGLAFGTYALLAGTSLIGGTNLIVTTALTLNLAWIGGVTSIVGGPLLVRASAG